MRTEAGPGAAPATACSFAEHAAAAFLCAPLRSLCENMFQS
jgi:hypothetical protein